MNEENKCDIGRQLQDSLQCSASKTPLNNLDENIHIIILAEVLLKNLISPVNLIFVWIIKKLFFKMYQNDKEETDVALEIHLFSGSITKGREQIGMLQQIYVQIYISPFELLFQLERVSILIHV